MVVDEYVTNYRRADHTECDRQRARRQLCLHAPAGPQHGGRQRPRTIVDQIASIVADYDLSRLSAKEGQVRSALSMRVLDAGRQ